MFLESSSSMTKTIGLVFYSLDNTGILKIVIDYRVFHLREYHICSADVHGCHGMLFACFKIALVFYIISFDFFKVIFLKGSSFKINSSRQMGISIALIHLQR